MKKFRNKDNTYSRSKGKQNTFSLILLILLILIFSSSCISKEISKEKNTQTSNDQTIDTPTLTIAVSVAPQKSIVEKITGDKANFITMIPQGYSPENFQPKPSSLEILSQADIYFTIDVPTEVANILPNLKDLNSKIKLVDLFDAAADKHEVLSFDLYEEFNTDDLSSTSSDKEDSDALDADEHEDHDHEGLDTHIWLSPKRIKTMAKSVLDEIIIADEKNKDFYTENYNGFIVELEELDLYIKDAFKDQTNKNFIIYHPSLGYYASDYNLNMIAIEENGKAATAKTLEKVIEFAKKKDIRVIFYQSEIDSSQVKVIASEINGEVIEINPLSENIIENLYMMTDILKNNLK